MNPPNSKTSESKHKLRFKLASVLAAGGLLMAACSDDASETADDTDSSTDTSMEMADGDMLGAFGPACGAVPADGAGSFAGMADETAANAASNNPLLSILVAAVAQADLVDTLNSDGPFTIFAPTNDAFDAIPESILSAVLADTDLLTSVLTYHVVAGESLDAEALGVAGSADTVEGESIDFGTDGTMVNNADVICSNVSVANGTVHIIDSVLLPQVALDAIDAMMAGPMDESMGDMLGAVGPGCAAVPTDGEGSFAGMADDTAATAASNNPLLSTLVTAVVEADLVDTLNSDGPFTILAPTNDAFAALPEGELDAVLADTDLLTSVLTYHVIAGQSLSAEQLIEAGTLTTVNGADLTFAAEGEAVSVNDAATTICQNVPTANATVHIIDGVLLP